MAARRRRWVPILFGVAVLLVFIGIGALIIVTSWVQQNLQIEPSSEPDARAEFDRVRQQFGGRPPLLEMRDGRPHYTSDGAASSPPAAGGSLETLYILAWDPDDGQLSRFSLPFWFLRLKSDPIEFSAYASGWDEGGVDLRPEDIEKYGPGIILDTGDAPGERVLLWAR